MPFKSAKQKKTIDAAAHNPEFAKKVGIKVKDAKKMSAHGKGQTKFDEATDTVEKDEKGNVKSWKHEGDWTKSKNKEGRGKVTNLSDKARRKTAKMGEKVAEEMPVITQGPNKGKKWSQDKPGVTNPNFPKNGIDKSGIPSPPDGATAPPAPVKAPRSEKRAEVSVDDQPVTASMKRTGKKVQEGWTHDTLAAKLFEHEDDQQPDDESQMAKSELLSIAENAMEIFKAIKDNENLDAWVSSYISIANDHLNSVAEALQGEQVDDTMEISADDDYFESLNNKLRNQLKG